MSNDNSLIPQGNDTGKPVISIASINREAVATIREIIANEQIPKSKRRDMVRQEIAALMKVRETQLSGILAIEKDRVAAGTAAMRSQIEKEKREFIMTVERDFVQIVASLGIEVAMSKLKCMDELDRQLTAFCIQLEQSPNRNPKRKADILNSAEETYSTVCQMLGAIAAAQISKLQADA